MLPLATPLWPQQNQAGRIPCQTPGDITYNRQVKYYYLGVKVREELQSHVHRQPAQKHVPGDAALPDKGHHR